MLFPRYNSLYGVNLVSSAVPLVKTSIPNGIPVLRVVWDGWFQLMRDVTGFGFGFMLRTAIEPDMKYGTWTRPYIYPLLGVFAFGSLMKCNPHIASSITVPIIGFYCSHMLLTGYYVTMTGYEWHKNTKFSLTNYVQNLTGTMWQLFNLPTFFFG